MSTLDFPNDIANSTSDTPAPVDGVKLEENFTKLESEWQDGSNTDFNVATGTVKNLNTAVGEANTMGNASDTTVNALVANIATANITAGKGIVPIGTILMYGGAVPPTNFKECDGESLARGTYASLFTAIGTNWGAADASHFNIPDLRGLFVRGWDNSAGNDPDSASRTANNAGGNTGDLVGSQQADAFQDHAHAHTHDVTSAQDDQVDDTGRDDTQTYDNVAYSAGGSNNATSEDSSNSSTGRSTTETRPANANVMFIIRYQ